MDDDETADNISLPETNSLRSHSLTSASSLSSSVSANLTSNSSYTSSLNLNPDEESESDHSSSLHGLDLSSDSEDSNFSLAEVMSIDLPVDINGLREHRENSLRRSSLPNALNDVVNHQSLVNNTPQAGTLNNATPAQNSTSNNANINADGNNNNNNAEPARNRQQYTFRRSDLPLIFRTCVLNLSIRYLKSIPRLWRRYLELFFAIKALLCLMILFYSSRMFNDTSAISSKNSYHPPCFTIPENITGLLSHGILKLEIYRKNKNYKILKMKVTNGLCQKYSPTWAYDYRYQKNYDYQKSKYLCPGCCLPSNDLSRIPNVSLLSSIEVSRHDSLIRLPAHQKKLLNIREETQFIYENDVCIGNRLKRLILMTTASA